MSRYNPRKGVWSETVCFRYITGKTDLLQSPQGVGLLHLSTSIAQAPQKCKHNGQKCGIIFPNTDDGGALWITIPS